MADQYSRDDIYQAMRNADAAGDSASVQRLGEYLNTMDQAGGKPEQAVPQYQGWARWPALTGQALAQGTAELVGIPGDLEYLGNAGLNYLRGDVSPKEIALQNQHRAPTGGEIIDRLGLQGPALVPTTLAERYATTGVKAVPAAAAVIASGGAAWPALAGTVLPAEAGQVAHDLAPDNPWAPIVAGLVTGLGIGGVTRQIGNFLNARAVNKAVSEAESKLATASSNFENATDTKLLQTNDNATNVQNVKEASRTNFAATREQLNIDKAAHHEQQDNVIETVAKGLGSSQTLQDAGIALQNHARDWINKILPAKLEALWGPVNEAIPKDAPVNLGAFGAALKSINTSAGKLEPLATLLKPGAPKALGKALAAVGNLGELTTGEEALAASQTHAWGDVQKLRSTLGDAMSNPRVIADVGAKNLERLYASLTADMSSTAEAQGAGDLFSSANAESRRLYQIGEGPMSRLVAGGRASAEDPVPEAVAKGLLTSGKSGASDLAVLRQEIPHGVNELGAAALRTRPQDLTKFSPEMVGTLLPSPEHSGTALGALAAKEQASAAAKQGVKLAQQIHQENIAAASKAAQTSNFQNRLNLRNSSKALNEARTARALAIEAQKNLPSRSIFDHSGASISGLLLGEQVGQAADNFLLKNSGLGQAGGAFIGALAPNIVRGGVNFLKPSSTADLLPPALGAFSGANALYGKNQLQSSP